MTDVTPYRITLADWLLEQGEDVAPAYRCSCGTIAAPAEIMDVRDRPDLFPAPFVCRAVCKAILDRQETYEREQAEAAALAAAGQIHEEKLNDCRARRDRALGKSDWIEFPSSQARVGTELTAAWLNYRAAVWAWFHAARDNGLIGDFPLSPDEQPQPTEPEPDQ
jgi:hypothetical protein